MPGPRILVVDGNVADVRARQVALVGEDSGAGYVKMLRRLLPDLDCDIIRPADGQPELPAGVGIGSYDGVAVTGSALNVYNGGASVDRQVDVAKAERQHALVEASKREEVANELVHAVDFGDGALEQRGCVRSGMCDRHLQLGLQRGEWVAQLMRYVRDQLALPVA